MNEINEIGHFKVNEIYVGDARELMKALPDQSIDLIFTDPPYLQEYLELYDAIFEASERILKASGFLLIYVGGYWKDHIMASARRHLEYFWDYIVWEPGNSPVNWSRKTIARNKSILAYRRKGCLALPNTQVLSVWLGGGEDKRYHIWGQNESVARYYINCFSQKGDLILDVCAGGGTSLFIAKKLGRKFIGFEIDPTIAEIAEHRISQIEQVEITSTVPKAQRSFENILDKLGENDG